MVINIRWWRRWTSPSARGVAAGKLATDAFARGDPFIDLAHDQQAWHEAMDAMLRPAELRNAIVEAAGKWVDDIRGHPAAWADSGDWALIRTVEDERAERGIARKWTGGG